jgi:hypothetical protein
LAKCFQNKKDLLSNLKLARSLNLLELNDQALLAINHKFHRLVMVVFAGYDSITVTRFVGSDGKGMLSDIGLTC